MDTLGFMSLLWLWLLRPRLLLRLGCGLSGVTHRFITITVHRSSTPTYSRLSLRDYHAAARRAHIGVFVKRRFFWCRPFIYRWD